ncbi:MAG: uroporphyrinogen-III C-methyltransferase [Rhodocyclaceae bacterium]|nr:uroporphyrinogen-III C-methyltransferase [Rhodocyclaceae bacterium]
MSADGASGPGTPAATTPAAEPSTAAPPAGRTPGVPAWRQPASVAAAIVLAVVAWQWWETRSRTAAMESELSRRLAESGAAAAEGRTLARQNQEAVLALQAKVGALEARLAEAQGQQLALESMYQELSRSRDERLVAEVEQSVSIAAQQLQLAGNVEAALIALGGADARLARASGPQLLALRKLINRDMERLKAAPNADVPGIALKLEGVVVAVEAMPLAFEQRPRVEPVARPAKPTEAGYWRGLAEDFWREMRQLVRIERIDEANHRDPALLSPGQSFFLRENLRLRLLNARLSLLTRDGRSYREDIRQARDWLDRYFDTRAKSVQAAQATLKALAAVDVAQEPPNLNETLTALRNFKLTRDREPAASRAPGPAR